MPNQKAKIKNKNKSKFIFRICFSLFLGFVGLLAGRSALAATAYLSPAAGSYEVGDLVTANVFINTENTAINNAEASINFSKDLLEVISVSKSGSIFSLWVEEPSFSNGAGSISFNGGLPTPGYNGTAGKAISIVFRAKAAGTASVVFSSCAVRANDGFGTNVFRGSAGASFNLVKVETPPTPPPTEPGEQPQEPSEPSDTEETPEITEPTEPTEPEEVILNPFSLPAPVITTYPSELEPGEPFIVQGTVLADLQVMIWLQFGDQEPQSHMALRDQSGNFVYIHQTQLANGKYKLWAEAVDSVGNHSEPTPQYDVMVQTAPQPAWWAVGQLTTKYLSFIISLLALILLFILLVWYGWRKLRALHRHVRSEIGQTQILLYKEFDLLRDQIQDGLQALKEIKDQRPLTQKEEDKMVKLDKHLDYLSYIEAKIKKEIKDIQKQVK